MSAAPGRNDPCPCGSGKKYKHCCLEVTATANESDADLIWRRLRRTLEGLPGKMLRFTAETYGKQAFDEAWAEFVLGDEQDIAADWSGNDHQAVFLAWLLHRWAPDSELTRVENTRLHDLPPTRAFLQRYSGTLDPAVRRYLESCLSTPLSFHEITAVERGRSFRARELLFGDECAVHERSATETMQAGDLLYGSLVPIDGIVVLEACSSVLIPPIRKLELIELRQVLLRDNEKNSEMFAGDFLRLADPLLRAKYLDVMDEILNPPMPQLRNTDGDELSLQKLVFDIDSAKDAFEALCHLSILETREGLLADARFDAAGELTAVQFTWSKRGNRQHKDWDNTTLGAISIDRKRLTVEVNSNKRARKFKQIVAKALGGKARFRVAQIQSVEHALTQAGSSGDSPQHKRRSTARSQRDPSQDDLASRPEVQAMMNSVMAAHYERWIDEKLPALKSKTPLQAIRTAAGREKVEALIAQIERDGSTAEPPLDPAITRRLRERLGLPLR